MTATPATLRVLLAGVIDYAGLFPPAGLDLASAVRNHSRYRSGPDAWALGRFIAPAQRLDALGDLIGREAGSRTSGAAPWLVSALLGADTLETDLEQVARFEARFAADVPDAATAVVDSLEVRAAREAEIARAASLVPPGVALFVEIPVREDPRPLVEAIRAAGVGAKIRTGGVTADAFPPSRDVVRFLHRCVAADVPFKATAGLHHPLRARYRLTYEPGAPEGTMFGFLNVLLATALLRAGADEFGAVALLEESDPGALRLGDEAVDWRGARLTLAQLREARERGLRSLGSCSFEEPLADLRALGFLEPDADTAAGGGPS